VSARWEHVKRAVEIRNEFKSDTLIFGNGDIADLDYARLKAKESGADGVMFGRAIFGNPWLFSGHIPTTKQKLNVTVEHTQLFEKLLGDVKNFSVMKKHFKAYVNGFDGAVELRGKLMETDSAEQVKDIVDDFLITKKVNI
jgi:tRNA-dihydrouridine synthase